MESCKRLTQSVAMVALFLLAGCTFVPTISTTPANNDHGKTVAEKSTEVELIDPAQSVPGKAKQKFSRAIAAMKSGQWAQAEQGLLQLTQAYPKLSGPWLNLALTQQQLGNTEQAEQNFRQALAVNAGNLDAYNQYGIFLRQQGRFKAAEAQYRKALRKKPDHAATHINLGILYDLYMGRLNDALIHYRKYQQLAASETPKIAGWIVDLERRINRMAMK